MSKKTHARFTSDPVSIEIEIQKILKNQEAYKERSTDQQSVNFDICTNYYMLSEK